MATQRKASGFSGLDDGWDFAEGTGEFYTPLPSECEPTFLPVICVVSSISQLRPEDLASFSAPNMAIASDTDVAMSSDAWFQELPGTSVLNQVQVARLPAEQAQPEFSAEILSADIRPSSTIRSIWKRFTAR